MDRIHHKVQVYFQDSTKKAKEMLAFRYLKKEVYPLTDYNVVMMRQDPPFDLSYITATHILEKLPKSTLVVNNPYEVRNAFPTRAPTCTATSGPLDLSAGPRSSSTTVPMARSATCSRWVSSMPSPAATTR